MPAQYFTLPLPNHPALIEVQEFLKTKLPQGAAWQDPATFHITLAYAEDNGGADLSQLAWPKSLPVFGLGGQELGFFDTPDGTAVHVRFWASPQLVALQAVLFYEAMAAGARMSAYSWPGMYKAHATLAYLPAGVMTDAWMPLPSEMHIQIERFALSGEGYQEVASFELSRMVSGGTVAELDGSGKRHVVQELSTFELGKPVPEVPFAAGIDLEALTFKDRELGTEPKFVTHPIMMADVISGNGFYYSAEFVQDVVRQVNDKRTPGIRGHIKNEDRPNVYVAAEFDFVGAVYDPVTQQAYGKAYYPPGELRDHIVRREAVKGKVATSIYGDSESKVWNQAKGAWEWVGFELESIGLADPQRAGIRELAAVPHVTAEMKREVPMDRNDIIKGLTVDDVALLPEPVRAAVMAGSAERKAVAEMRQTLSLADDANLIEVVKELHQQVSTLNKAAVTARIKELVIDEKTGVKVSSARGIVMELVQAANPATVADVDKVFGDVMERQSVKEMLQGKVQDEMGDPQRRPLNGGDGDGKDSNQFVIIPKDEGEEKK
jgi:hypothetical protein